MTNNEIAARRLQEETRAHKEQERIGKMGLITGAIGTGLSALARVRPTEWASVMAPKSEVASVDHKVRSLKHFGFGRRRKFEGGNE